MGFPDYKRDLSASDFDPVRMLNRYFHSGQSVAFLGADPEEEPSFKSTLAHLIHASLGVQLHPFELVLCGSAHLGFSPVPEKLGKPFNSLSSDIDVAVVSTELFDRWWAELQTSGLVPAVLTRVAEDLFWGFINPANVNNVSKIGNKWWQVFGDLQTDRAKGVRGRLYRNYWSMQNYHMHAINGGRNALNRMRT
jgi:hypothetical protein